MKTAAALSTTAALARAARLLAGLPPRIEASAGALGALALEPTGVEVVDAQDGDLGEADVVLGVTDGLDRGRLVLDGALTRAVVARALGGELGALARVGHAERGLVAGLVASALHAARAPFSVSLAPPPARLEAGVALVLSVSVAGVLGWARVEAPAAWFSRVTPRVSDEVLAAREVEIAVELARTTLAGGELDALAPGDAVVFDGERALTTGGVRQVRVVSGAHAARAQLDAGRVRLSEAFERPALDAEAAPDDGDARARAPVVVVAELGRLRLGGAEVARLVAGAELALAPAAAVTLRVRGQARATGELTEIDGALAVRVTTV